MKILIIGQTPPPYGGQAINIMRLLHALDKQTTVEYKFLRMHFSEEMNETGKTSYKKIFRLFSLVFKVFRNLIVYRPHYVYYPPSGPELVPVIRDMAVLSVIRAFRKKIIFHFHAGGLRHIYPQLNGLLKKGFDFCYKYNAWSVCLSEAGRKDPEFLGSKNIVVFASGVDDVLPFKAKTKQDDLFRVLFVGVCRESKGILDYIKIIEKARSANPLVKGVVIGKVFSEKEKLAIDASVRNNSIEYLGVRTGDDKNKEIGKADAFLFPTFFEHENFPTVIMEAFSCALPVVTTPWRGTVDQVIPGVNGYLINVHDIESGAARIITLAKKDENYTTMAANARKSFESLYSIEQYQKNVINFFNQLP